MAVSALVTAVPASATVVTPAGCGASYATVTSTGGSSSSWNCSGEHDINVYGSWFSAGGWSGAVYTYDQGTYWFCDFNQFSLNGAHVYEVYMNATKPSRCT